MAMGDPMGEPHMIEPEKGDPSATGPRYDMGVALLKKLEGAFVYHAPKADQPARYKMIRDMAGAFARLVCEQVPDSRERSLALTNIEQAVMWANAGIARTSKP